MSSVIVGLGYVGLPLAQAAAAAGIEVVGFDTNERVVAALNAGRSHVDDISDAEVARMLESGFRATSDPAALAGAEYIVICVPTPLDETGGPDLRAVLGATETIAANLQPGTTVILESTTYPGTTEEVVQPILERGGLRAGIDFHLAFSPERVDPGNRTYTITNTPKVVGGIDPASTVRASAFYARFVDEVVPASGTREAETAKLLENTYRHINIALVNEMAQFSHQMGIDIWEVVRLARTKPFGFQSFSPGAGVGGHCIPIDPNYLAYKVRAVLDRPFRFVELAEEINGAMPGYVARRVQDLLNDHGLPLRGSRVTLLGVTYKPDISDRRESPAVPLAARLRELGGELAYHDPRVEDWDVDGLAVPRVATVAEALATSDVVVVVQPHREYLEAAAQLSGPATPVLDATGRFEGSQVVRL